MASAARPPIVLIVIDDRDLLAMYAFGLLAMGFQPVTAETADQALTRARQCRLDAIVVDVTLGAMSGLDLARRLRADARSRDAAVIMLAGDSSAAVRQEARDAGSDRFLMKPCLPDKLAVEIREVLVAKHRGHRVA